MVLINVEHEWFWILYSVLGALEWIYHWVRYAEKFGMWLVG